MTAYLNMRDHHQRHKSEKRPDRSRASHILCRCGHIARGSLEVIGDVLIFCMAPGPRANKQQIRRVRHEMAKDFDSAIASNVRRKRETAEHGLGPMEGVHPSAYGRAFVAPEGTYGRKDSEAGAARSGAI